MWTDDPVADAERYFAEQDRQMERLPVCVDCDQPITDDFYYEINGECLCQNCLEAGYRKSIDDYIE